LRFAVGFKLHDKSAHVVVDAEDALIAALKVKMQHQDASIMYVRRRKQVQAHHCSKCARRSPPNRAP
jgi:hypothetical protein